MLADLLFDGSLLLLLVALGALIAWIILLDGDLPILVMLAFPLGAGIFTLVLFLASWIGVPIRPLTVYGLLLLLLGVAGLIAHKQQLSLPRRLIHMDDGPMQGSTAHRMPYVIAAGWLILSMILSIGRAYSTWDAAAIWSVKGYGIASEGTIFAGATWGAHGLSYPLNIPLLIAAFDVLGGDLLPGSKLIFPLFYGSLLLGCIALWRKHGVPHFFLTLGTLLIASVPVIFEHSTMGYANLPFSTYLLLACIMTIEGNVQSDRGLQLMGGVLFGLAAWTRPEGVFLVPLLMLTVVLFTWASQRRMPRLIPWLLPVVLITGLWIPVSYTHLTLPTN